MDESSVRVALRIRPQVPSEVIDMCRVCTQVTAGEPQIWLGSDKAFTYDHVFDTGTGQGPVYEACVKDLIRGTLDGYNATILAYGQTGSGKTYTMGTGFDMDLTSAAGDLAPEQGIIPRAVHHLFASMEEIRQATLEAGQPPPEFKMNAQFMELYNEEIYDLFDPARNDKRSSIRIHEDALGGIYVTGVATRLVTSTHETLQCLKAGALSRTTASTQMNAQSSRSHAIFTLHIKQQRLVPSEEEGGAPEFETLTAKLHFVDLAGSERLKRTGATGDRAKEGISINCGLLALGNVISALGDKSRRVTHVPYRDSKLTRLLQDSLGGNSRTLMIACVSPSDRDFMETLNTLKYANRARNIQNRITINQDKNSKTLALLRQEIAQLQLELAEYKQGKRVINGDGEESINDMFHENKLLQTENGNLRTRIKALQETVDSLTARNSQLLAERAQGDWMTAGEDSDVTKLIQGYLQEIEELRAKLCESESIAVQLRKALSQRSPVRAVSSPSHVAMAGHYDVGMEDNGNQVQQLIMEARRGLEKKQTLIKKNRLNERERSSRSESGVKEDGDEREEEEIDESDTSESEDKDKDGEGSESETSEDDEEQLTEKYGAELAELTSEITMKQRLIDELELSQKRLDLLKEQYESKMQQLQTKIRNVEIERDRVLAGYGGGPPNHQAEEKVKKIKEDYEKKLGDLQKELKRLQSAQREHAKLLRNQSEYERQLKTLRGDLAEIKKNKVKLMQRMREEASKYKEEELKRSKEIMQLRKQTRQHENQIRTLQAEKQLKDTVLRRKQEEVSALRKMAKGGLSEKAAGRVPLAAQVRAARRLPFSPKAAKQKWQKMEKEVMQLAVSKQAVSSMEREMERSLRQRDELRVALERTLAQRNRAVMESRDESFVQELEDQLESLRANIDYIQDTISDCQQQIMQLEDGKEGLDALESAKVLQTISLEEARYLIQKLLSMTINQSILASQREYQFHEVQSNLKQVSENNAIHQQLLQHLLVNSDVEVYNLMAASNTTFPVIDSTSYDAIPLGSLESSRSASPTDLSSAALSLTAGVPTNAALAAKPNKARRRTALPDELLYGFPQNLPGSSAQEEEDDAKLSDTDAVISFTQHARPPPYGGPTNNSAVAFATKAMQRVPSAPGPLRSMGVAGTSGGLSRTLAAAAVSPSSDLMTRSLTLKAEPPSPRLARKTANLSATNLAAARLLSSDPEITTPPSSPPTYRRSTSREENPNVFSRLTSGTAVATQQQPGTGTINAFAGKMSNKTPLLCSFVAEGHSKAVLSICATDDRLFSGSKDRTVKVWDLVSGREIMALENHPNNVIAVRYSESTRLAFSVSSAFIKIWDLRLNPVRCVKTLCSSGSTSLSQPMGLVSRSVQLPAGETLVNDIALSQVHPHLLYSAAGNQVRAFDLRRYACVAKLSGGHQAAVMCLAVASQSATDEEGIPNGELVITGSKDHYIKVFDVGEGASGLITPRFNLDPPHYDGVQCLAMHGSVLFSGSRDACIKKWDLEQAEMVQSLNNVHKDWICGMSVLPGGQYLVSGCRAGHMKLWSTDAGAALGEMKAHNYGINAIATNSTHVFTASSDNTVGLWRVRNNLDISPDYE